MQNRNIAIVNIDFSVLTEKYAIGRVYGRLDVFVVPQIGDNIVFPLIVDGQSIVENGHLIDLATRHFSVVGRIIYPSGSDMPVSLSLDDVIAETPEDALELMKYFESAHGLVYDAYDL